MINIDLTKHYNHKFIYREERDVESRGLDGTYILAKDIKYKLEVTTRLDNISCDNQVVDVNCAASKIQILGFAYWGSTNEFIDVVYEDEVKRVKVPFIDWVQPVKDKLDLPTRLDNISCDNQVIEVNHKAAKLHILGFAYWGSTNEFIDIVYEDETVRVKVPFIDWVHPSKDSYETRSWFGRDVKTVMKIKTCGVLHHTAYFHKSSIMLDSSKLIKQIVLPDNFLIHIFKITIED